jgi:hypothetical protein
MGMPLQAGDFAIVARRPWALLLGGTAQYVVMPSVGYGLALALDLTPALAAGMVLVGAAPGGTASNVMGYLSRGDAALSVAMTTVSTMLAPVLSPAVVPLLADEFLPVDAAGLFTSILQIVLAPVLIGLLLRTFANEFVERVLPVLPLISVNVGDSVGGSTQASPQSTDLLRPGHGRAVRRAARSHGSTGPVDGAPLGMGRGARLGTGRGARLRRRMVGRVRWRCRRKRTTGLALVLVEAEQQNEHGHRRPPRDTDAEDQHDDLGHTGCSEMNVLTSTPPAEAHCPATPLVMRAFSLSTGARNARGDSPSVSPCGTSGSGSLSCGTTAVAVLATAPADEEQLYG